MDIEIRNIKRIDEEAIAKLAGQLGYPTSVHELRERLAQILEDENQAVFVAESPEMEVVGWVHVFKAHRLVVEPFAEIGGLVVIEEWRASGVGRALLKTAETWARDRVVSGMRVRSNIIREGAQRFYEHLGYNNVKTQNVFLKELVSKDYKSS